MPGYLLRPSQYQLCYLVKVPRKENGCELGCLANISTYPFASECIRGLMSLDLNDANHSSQGDAAYEWGPV